MHMYFNLHMSFLRYLYGIFERLVGINHEYFVFTISWIKHQINKDLKAGTDIMQSAYGAAYTVMEMHRYLYLFLLNTDAAYYYCT